MQINVTFDSSVANAPSGFVPAFNAAVAYLDKLIGNPVTVNISVGWGEVGGTALAANALGENIEPWVTGLGYYQIGAALKAVGAPGSSSLPPSDPTHGGQFDLTSAEAKALGFLAPNASVTDGWIGFGTAANYDFDTNLSDPVLPGTYPFFATAVHELSELLGRQLDLGAGGQYTPLDLDHFSAPGVHALTSWGGYFSTDDGATALAKFNVNTNWGDPGDWLPVIADAFNVMAYPGESMPITASDVSAIQSLGWTLSSQQQTPQTKSSFSLAGTQLFDGTAGNESVIGGNSGNETVWGGANNVVMGGAANMTIGGAQNETIIGGTGYEFLDGSIGNTSIVGGSSGSEMIWSGPGDTIYGGGNASDTIGGVPGSTIIGGIGPEFIDGSSGNQIITGGSAGNETIWGGPGNTVYGGGDANVTIGGGLHDTIIGGTGTELLSGWLGQQVIVGGSGNETITGAATDTITGGTDGNEFINSSTGNQLITGGSGGNETIWAGAGDTVNGGGAANETIGGVAGDTITGGSGNEFIDGTGGNQLITAGSGNETIWAGAGDTINGGSGQAIIALGAGPELVGGAAVSGGSDTVIGFNLSSGDRIVIPSGSNAGAVLASAVTTQGSTTITFGGGSTLTLVGVAQLDNTFLV